MQPELFQTAECEMKTPKFLQGARRKTILGELYNKVPEREIERTFKIETDLNSYCIARSIYDKLKEKPEKALFSLLHLGIIRLIIIQTHYELEAHKEAFDRKITVNLYEKEQAAVKIKSSTVIKHKKVKVTEERKFFIPSINGKKPEDDIQAVLQENIPDSLKEGNSWRKEKYQIFVELNKNIFTISVSQVHMLPEKEDSIDVQSKVSLRRIEVEYQGTQWSDPSEIVQVQEENFPDKQDTIESEKKAEKGISRQIRKISHRVLEICKNELCLSLVTV
jgi:hypothetical protein